MHTDSPSIEATDWSQIVALYDQLLAVAPSDVVRLNRAVAVAERDGPDAGLVVIDGLDLEGYGPFHVSRAELLRSAGRYAEARAAYDVALALTVNAAEQAHLRARLASLSA